MYKDSADVVIIGGGVSGLSSAYFLAKAGRDVVVVEKGNVGSEASGRNGGLITVGLVDEYGVRPTAVESMKMWPTLEAELGYPTEFVHQGMLSIAMTEEQMDDIFTTRDNYLKNGLTAKVVDSPEVRDMIPGISEKVVGGLFSPEGGHANPQRTVQAFAWAFQDRGGRLYQHTAVTGITVRDGRVSSVETTAGAIKTGVVVSAAGPQTGLIGEMVGVYIPVAPFRVESIATVPLEPRFDVALGGNGLYGRQGLRGNLLFGGGPFEWTEVDLTGEPAKPSTPLIRNIARRLAELLPSIEDLRVLRAWAGIVEMTPDGDLIIDKLDYPQGFVLVSQSGHGFALCPATGVAVSQLIVDGKCSFDIQRFELGRFKGIARSWRRSWGWESGTYST